MNPFFEEYFTLRNAIDLQCSTLWELYKNNMKCKQGCSKCCESFRILPLEFHAIQYISPDKTIKINTNASKTECVFLVRNKCAIYENRPIMCRTHGFPLVRLNEEAGAYEVSFCDLNFIRYKLSKFTEENVIQEDQINSKLFMLNKRFIQKNYPDKYEPLELIELNDIFKGE